MTAAALAATSVLVTRPREQAAALCAKIEAHGGTAIGWPAVKIAPRSADHEALARLDQVEAEDIAVFVSRNAVKHGAQLLQRSA